MYRHIDKFGGLQNDIMIFPFDYINKPVMTHTADGNKHVLFRMLSDSDSVFDIECLTVTFYFKKKA